MRSFPTVGLFATAVFVTACSSSGGGVGTSVADRLHRGYTQIGSARSYDYDFSIARRTSTDTDDETLSCLSISRSGEQVGLINWGSGTVLDGSGGCEGGGDPKELFIDGQDAITAGSPAPKHTTCIAGYQRHRMSAAVRAQLRSFATSQGPKLDRLLATATSSSGTGSVVTLTLDPAKAASLAGHTSGANPDSETMTVTFAGDSSSTISAVELSGAAGGDTLYVRAEYRNLDKDVGHVLPDASCVTGRGTPITDLAVLKSALGF